MKDAPNEWTVETLCRHINSGQQSGLPDGRYVPARPIGFYSIPSRARLAWAVFTGKADALFWHWPTSPLSEPKEK